MTSPTPSRITGVRPLWGVEGGWLTISGDGFSMEPLPQVMIGNLPARVVAGSGRAMRVSVPAGLDGGDTPVRLQSVPGESALVQIGAPLATGLHVVDNPAFDRDGNLFVTFSGSRGQQSPVSIYVVRPDGSRAPFVTDLPNPTSLAFDREGRLHVSSRFDGSVYRVGDDGGAEVVATDLGVACGIAFDPDGILFVGDRAGSILRVVNGKTEVVASIPPSIAAFHLAFGPDGSLFVTGPTLNTRDAIYRVSTAGDVDVFYEGFGRPQGMAFDEAGRLYVADAIAGTGGLYRFGADGSAPELLISAGGLVGLAFGRSGTLAVASSDTVYRLDAGISGLLPFTRP